MCSKPMKSSYLGGEFWAWNNTIVVQLTCDTRRRKSNGEGCSKNNKNFSYSQMQSSPFVQSTYCHLQILGEHILPWQIALDWQWIALEQWERYLRFAPWQPWTSDRRSQND